MFIVRENGCLDAESDSTMSIEVSERDLMAARFNYALSKQALK